MRSGARLNDGNGTDSGHVRVYEWNGSAWTQKGADIDGEAAGDESGFFTSLSPDGTTLAMGARLNDGNRTDSGHVRVYEWNGSAWTQKGADIDGEAAGDESGRSVSLSSDGTVVAIGAYQNSEAGGNAGHVRGYSISTAAPTRAGAHTFILVNASGVTHPRSGMAQAPDETGEPMALTATHNLERPK